MNRALLVIALSCMVLGPARAAAQALHWEAPAGCPDAAYVEQRIASLTQGTKSNSEPMQAHARITGARGHYVLALEVRSASGVAERTITASQCQSLADAAAFLIAVARDPKLAESPAARSTADQAEDDAQTRTAASGAVLTESSDATRVNDSTNVAPPPAAAAPSLEAEPASTASETRTLGEKQTVARPPSPQYRAPPRPRLLDEPRWWRAGVYGGYWRGQLPGAQASAGARGGYGLGALLFELRGGLMFPRSAQQGAVRSRFSTQELASAVCALWGGDLRAGPCLELAVLRTQGNSVSGATDRQRQALLWGSGGLSAQVGYRALRDFELLAELGVALPVSARPRFVVEGAGEVAVAAAYSVYARVGLAFRPPDLPPKRQVSTW